MTTSGTYNFSLTNADMALEVLERVDVRGAAITSDHLISLNRSFNLVQAMWANRGVNLWKVDLVSVPLVQGQTLYNVSADTVMMLDVYLRTYAMNGPQNMAPAFSTTIGSPFVTIQYPSHGLLVGEVANVVIPVSVGGFNVNGFYNVVSVPSINVFVIQMPFPATANVTLGGVVPILTTSAASAIIQVDLPNHGYLPGQTFTVQVPMVIGSIAIQGAFSITTVIDADTFTITAPYISSFADTQIENGGLAQIATQQTAAVPYDRVMTPISRNDYSALPNKFQQSPPTQYWFDRLATQPTVTVWPVPDSNGPYAMQYYRVRQVQDVKLPNGSQSPDIPYRFFEAFCADTAAHMAIKWAVAKQAPLQAWADRMWQEAAAEDRERVSLYIRPDVSAYYI